MTFGAEHGQPSGPRSCELEWRLPEEVEPVVVVQMWGESTEWSLGNPAAISSGEASQALAFAGENRSMSRRWTPSLSRYADAPCPGWTRAWQPPELQNTALPPIESSASDVCNSMPENMSIGSRTGRAARRPTARRTAAANGNLVALGPLPKFTPLRSERFRDGSHNRGLVGPIRDKRLFMAEK